MIPSGKILTKSIDDRKYLRNKNAVAFCNLADIDTLRSKNHIKSNKYQIESDGSFTLRTKGIPQGSPISAVLANIYLAGFDKNVNGFVSKREGIYRRYSDDMVVVCEAKYQQETIDFFTKQIQNYELDINHKKTQVFLFKKNGNGFKCFEENLNTGLLHNKTKFDYLGFSFDGQYTTLKSSSLASFHRKMKRSIKRGKFFSRAIQNNTNGQLFKARLYKRFTFRGAKRRKIYKRLPGTTNKWKESKKFDWGNYLSYAKKAAAAIPDNKIKSQISRHWRLFHKLLKLKIN